MHRSGIRRRGPARLPTVPTVNGESSETRSFDDVVRDWWRSAGGGEGILDVPLPPATSPPTAVVEPAAGPFPAFDRGWSSSAAVGHAPPAGPGRRGVRAEEFGALADLVADPDATDVFVNGPEQVLVDRGRGPERRHAVVIDEVGLRALAVRLAAAGGRHVDEANPCVDVRLHDGIRVHVVLPPISPAGTLISIRLPRVAPLSLDDLVGGGMLDAVERDRLLDLVARRRNLLVTGAGGTGKTTLLAALLSAAPEHERIIAVEDVAELRVVHPQFVALETRQANIEGAGGVGLERLVREALRMRPDRLVLGECRGAEVRELLSALNTGHDGGAGTLHANSLHDVPARLEALGALAGMTPEALARQAVSGIDAVVHLERRGGDRRIAAIGGLVLDGRGHLVARELP